MSTPSERLAELGLELPPVAAPVAAYVPAIRVGDLVYTSGQLPFRDGQLTATGKVGAGLSVEEAAGCARLAALNGLAAAAALTGGLDAIAQIVKVVIYVASPAHFAQQAAVGNGASQLLLDVFGEAGRHARSAVGVVALPLDAPVEVELIVRVASRPTVQPVAV